jgi:hypothetical protein
MAIRPYGLLGEHEVRPYEFGLSGGFQTRPYNFCAYGRMAPLATM